MTGTFAITTPTDITVSSSSTGTNYPYKTEYPLRKFFAYNNGNLVAERIAYAECDDKNIWSTEDNKCMPKEVAFCAEPTSRIVEVACDQNEYGEEAISGSVKREQTKTYPACIFGEPITVNNSVYVSDSCIYPSEDGNGGDGDGSDGEPRWGNRICGECSEGVQQVECTEFCESDPSTGKFCIGDKNKDGIRSYYSNCQTGGGSFGKGTPILNIVMQFTPDKIVKGRSAVLSWDSNSDSCVAVVGGEYGYFETNGANNGSFLVAPTETTSYRIQCEKGEVTEPAEATLKVTNVNIIES